MTRRYTSHYTTTEPDDSGNYKGTMPRYRRGQGHSPQGTNSPPGAEPRAGTQGDTQEAAQEPTAAPEPTRSPEQRPRPEPPGRPAQRGQPTRPPAGPPGARGAGWVPLRLRLALLVGWGPFLGPFLGSLLAAAPGCAFGF